MTSDKIKEMPKASPFRSFRMPMAIGRHADVVHPEFMILLPSGRKRSA